MADAGGSIGLVPGDIAVSANESSVRLDYRPGRGRARNGLRREAHYDADGSVANGPKGLMEAISRERTTETFCWVQRTGARDYCNGAARKGILVGRPWDGHLATEEPATAAREIRSAST